MFILVGKEQLEKATAKAKAKKVRTLVKFIEYGRYSVRGSNGNFYTVECKRINNQKIVQCNCRGGLSNLVCYHACAAISLHIGLSRQRQTA